MKYSTPLLTATNLILAATLIGACAEQPSDTQVDNAPPQGPASATHSDAGLLAHTPRSGVSGAALPAHCPTTRSWMAPRSGGQTDRCIRALRLRVTSLDSLMPSFIR